MLMSIPPHPTNFRLCHVLVRSYKTETRCWGYMYRVVSSQFVGSYISGPLISCDDIHRVGARSAFGHELTVATIGKDHDRLG